MVDEIITIVFAVMIIIFIILDLMTANKRVHDMATLSVLTGIFAYGVFIMAYNFIIHLSQITSSSSAISSTSLVSELVIVAIIIVMYLVTTIVSHLLLHRGLIGAWHANLTHKPIRVQK